MKTQCAELSWFYSGDTSEVVRQLRGLTGPSRNRCNYIRRSLFIVALPVIPRKRRGSIATFSADRKRLVTNSLAVVLNNFSTRPVR